MSSFTLTLCGSIRFADEMAAFAQSLRNAYGIVVHVPTARATPNDAVMELPEDVYLDLCRGRTWEHFHLIEIADAVFIFNERHPETKIPHAGPSVTLELGYATARKKPVYALRPEDPEGCRRGLYLGACATPEDLARALGLQKT